MIEEYTMGKLIDLDSWRKRRFDPPVSKRTAQNWAKNGHIPGAKQIGRLWFVDEEIERNSTGDDVVDSILASR